MTFLGIEEGSLITTPLTGGFNAFGFGSCGGACFGVEEGCCAACVGFFIMVL